jgi:glycosyltransferase involved in cell wall biosynthesis
VSAQPVTAGKRPAVVVFSTLFPHSGQPGAGLFIRERMFRVAAELPLVVVSPQPWFPFQGLLRRWKPHFRPPAPRQMQQQGVEVLLPRFFSAPGLFQSLDGLFMAAASYLTLRRLQQRGQLDILDAHFVYPDGYAATLLGRWLTLPVTITLRGTEPRHSQLPRLRPLMQSALQGASRIFTVSASLKRVAEELGADPGKLRVVGNGVDLQRFQPQNRQQQRQQLGFADDAKILISVGGLVPRKGYHRVIELLPALLRQHPALHYVVIGGPCAEGDNSAELVELITSLGLQQRVHLLGSMPPDALSGPLSAADLFVLSTSNEGWANVFLEAMACGLPVITTDVGGNAEVVCDPRLGTVVPFGDAGALQAALDDALQRLDSDGWQRDFILEYARNNSWDSRVSVLLEEFRGIAARGSGPG